MSNDRTLPPPPPRRAAGQPERSQTPVSGSLEPARPKQDTLRDNWPSERLDRPEEASELEAAREREAELLRQLQAAKAQQRPKIEIATAPTSSGTPSVAPATDQALGRIARQLAMKAGGALLLAVLGGGAGVAVDRQASPKVDVAAYEARIARLEQQLKDEREDDRAWKQRASQVFNCRAEQQADVNTQLLPDPDRLVNQRKPRAWVDECPVKIKAPD